MIRHLAEVHISRSEEEDAQECVGVLVDSFLRKRAQYEEQDHLLCLDISMIHQKLGQKGEALMWIKGALTSPETDVRILALVHSLFLHSDDSAKVFTYNAYELWLIRGLFIGEDDTIGARI